MAKGTPYLLVYIRFGVSPRLIFVCAITRDSALRINQPLCIHRCNLPSVVFHIVVMFPFMHAQD